MHPEKYKYNLNKSLIETLTNTMAIILPMVAVGLFIYFIVSFFIPNKEKVTITGFKWENRIEVGEMKEVATYRSTPVCMGGGRVTFIQTYAGKQEQWSHTRNILTTGSDKNPYWGEVNLSENEVKGDSSSVFKICVIDEKGKEKEYSIDEDTWQTLEVGQTVILKTGLGDSAEVESFEWKKRWISQGSISFSMGMLTGLVNVYRLPHPLRLCLP